MDDSNNNVEIKEEFGGFVWKFFQGGAKKWRWQKLSLKHRVISQSELALDQYWDCVQDARLSGYNGTADQVAQSG